MLSNVNQNQLPLSIHQHIEAEQLKFPNARGELSFLLSAIEQAAKAIHTRVAQSQIGGEPQELEAFAHETMVDKLTCRDLAVVLASEAVGEPLVSKCSLQDASYAVLFDPLDGSSNIDVNLSLGSIFSIVKRDEEVEPNVTNWVMQPGRKQVAAGYILYGSSTVFVYSSGDGVHGFTLDPTLGVFLLTHPNIRMPWQGKHYSVNEAYRQSFPLFYRLYFDSLRKGYGGVKYSHRYVGSLVADFHRTLIKGGVFAYPPTDSAPGGKLRLLHEVNPIGFLASQAGGAAFDGTRKVLDIAPKHMDQRSGFIVGGGAEMDLYWRYMRRPESLELLKFAT